MIIIILRLGHTSAIIACSSERSTSISMTWLVLEIISVSISEASSKSPKELAGNTKVNSY